METRRYRVADHNFAVYGPGLCSVLDTIAGFRPFVVHETPEEFSFLYSDELPELVKVQYSFGFENVLGEFGITSTGFFLRQKPADEDQLLLWCSEGDDKIYLNGNLSVRLVRFALWVGYGLITCRHSTVAIHSSCIVSDGRAVIFLGESGTGKSTHTRLWRENIPGATLLNDDSPIIRVIDGSVWVYGSPWSGKTPCYRQAKYPLAGCVRLSQAPYNRIQKLHVTKGFASLHPSCPPEFAYDERIYSHISNTLSGILAAVPCYHLECLPDAAAAELSFKTLLGTK